MHKSITSAPRSSEKTQKSKAKQNKKRPCTCLRVAAQKTKNKKQKTSTIQNLVRQHFADLSRWQSMAVRHTDNEQNANRTIHKAIANSTKISRSLRPADLRGLQWVAQAADGLVVGEDAHDLLLRPRLWQPGVVVDVGGEVDGHGRVGDGEGGAELGGESQRTCV